MKFILLIFTFEIAFLAAQNLSYESYHLLRLFPTSDEHVKSIENFEKTDIKFDIWNSVRQPEPSFDVLLPPETLLKYKLIFEANNLRYEILDTNIQNKIDEQQKSMLRNKADPSIINRYARYSEIMSFIDQTVQENSDIASSYIAGRSVENRLLKVIVLKTSKTSKKSLWIDCGIHAREWVSPATCVYTINRFINEFRNKDSKTVAILNKYDFHILPIVNPDGYEYTFNTMRLWRKNRQITYYSSCLGIDLNRNFGFKWFLEAGGTGASLSPCADTYCGEKAETAPEVLAVSNALRNKTGEWDAYINVHSYGNWWLLPYGYILSKNLKPINYDQMLEKGKIGVDAIKRVYNETFVIGPSSDLLYLSSGSAADFAYGELNIPYSFILELRPGPKSPDNKYGFTLPEDRLPLVTEETFAGIKEFFFSIV